MKRRKSLWGVLFLFVISILSFGAGITVCADVSDDPEYISDRPVLGKMDKDDFETFAEWEEYLNENPEQMIMTLGASEPDEHIQLRAEEVITVPRLVNDANNGKRVVQQIAFDDAGKYIYITQRVNVYTDKYKAVYEDKLAAAQLLDETATVNKNISTILYRCTYNEAKNKATVKDYMVIEGGGHGQTLEYYEHNGKPYFLITLVANEVYENSWGLRIGRLQYKPGTVINTMVDWDTGEEDIDVVHFKDLSYANKTGEYFGNIKRVDAALTNDRTKISFWVQNNNNDIQYSVYDAKALNKMWDAKEKATDKAISCYKNTALRKACITSFAQYGANRVLPNLSNQGTEIDNDLNMFIIGGNYNRDSLVPEVPQIGMIGTNEDGTRNFEKLISISNKEFGEYTEVEGMKLTHEGIYFTIADHSSEYGRYAKHIMFISYEQIDMQVKHTNSEVRNAKEATFTEDGYTGDIYCTDCGEIINTGVVIPKIKEFTYNNLKYKITNVGTNPTVACAGIVKNKTEVVIPEKVTYKDVTFKVTSVAAQAFRENSKIKKVTIGKNVKTIEKLAFYKMPKLTTVLGGANVKTIGQSAFSRSAKITKVALGSKVQKISDYAFYQNTKLKTVGFGSGVVSVGKRAFYYCGKLNNVKFGTKLKTIGERAFYKCSGLKKMTISSKLLTSKRIGSKAFSGIYNKAQINVNNSKKKAYKTLFRQKGIGKNVKVY